MDREHNAEDDEERDKVRQRRSRVCNVEGEEDPLEPQSGYFRSCSENAAKPLYFLDLRVKVNEYHKVLTIDSDTTKNFVNKLEFFIILKIILN